MVLSDFGSSGTDAFGQPQSSQALGTGFVVDKQGYILTNAHVVDESGQRASSVTVVFNKGGSETTRVPGQLVGVDVGSDVAVIKVDPSKVGNLNPLPLGDSDTVQVGEPVVAIGNPLGYDFSITSGIVSATGRSLQSPSGQTIPNGIQTDAAINQGNSGGPLIDSSGKVIGINEQIASSGGGNDGLGFAVPINTAVRSMEQLKANGKVTYAWMGVGVQTLTSDVASALNVQTQGGALVESVSPGSPAAKAGIKGGTKQVTVQGQQFTVGGDVITKVDDTTDQDGRRPHRLPRHQEAGRHGHGDGRAQRTVAGHPGHARAAAEQPLTYADGAPPAAIAAGRRYEVGRLPLFRVGGPLFLTCGPARVYTRSPGRDLSGARPRSHQPRTTEGSFADARRTHAGAPAHRPRSRRDVRAGLRGRAARRPPPPALHRRHRERRRDRPHGR